MSHWFDSLASTPPPIPALRRFLLEAGRADTLRHVSRVAVAGRKLARRFGLSLTQSDLACVAHDLAAVVPQREMVKCAEQLDAPVTEADRTIPQVVHGSVAAAVLQHRLAIQDDAVLNAVRYHTTLRAGASPLEQLVFIADKIEHDPTADHVGFHPALMEAVRANAALPELCLIYLDWAVHEGPRLGWRLHPNLLAAYAELGHQKEMMMPDIEKTIFIAAPIEKVWAALTEASTIGQWMEVQNIVSEAHVTGRYALFGGETTGQYTRVEPPYRLEYTWRQASWSAAWPDSLVRWVLVSDQLGTQVKLWHGQFPNAEERDGHDEGWEVYWLKPMKDWLEATRQA